MLLLLATMVWAETGETGDTEPPDPCAEMAAVPEACLSGETIVIEVTDCDDGDWTDDGVVFELSTDRGGGTFSGGAIDDDGTYRADFLCPDVACEGARQNIYLVVFDEIGQQDWVFGRVDVFCEPDATAEDPEEDGGAGCGCTTSSPSGAWAGAFGLLALLARRRAQ